MMKGLNKAEIKTDKNNHRANQKLPGVTAVLMSVCLLCSCSFVDEPQTLTSYEETTTEEYLGETVDSGLLTAIIPEGWYNYVITENGTEVTGKLHFSKGASDDADAISSPFVEITYYDLPVSRMDATLAFLKTMLGGENAQSVKIDVNGHECEGYSGRVLGYSETAFVIPVGEKSVVIAFSSDELSADDPDVRIIIENINIS